MVLIDTDGTSDLSNRHVIKHSLYRLTKGNEALISTIERLVAMNTANNDIDIPYSTNLIYEAFNVCAKREVDLSKMIIFDTL